MAASPFVNGIYVYDGHKHRFSRPNERVRVPISISRSWHRIHVDYGGFTITRSPVIDTRARHLAMASAVLCYLKSIHHKHFVFVHVSDRMFLLFMLKILKTRFVQNTTVST